VPLGERPPEPLQWLGASFGLTQALFNFWSRAGYAPVYLRQTASDITGARAPRPRAPRLRAHTPARNPDAAHS
jgi:hypothetical protein